MKLNPIALLIILILSCKEDEEVILPALKTTSASMVTTNSAVLNGQLTIQGSSPIDDHGFIWSLSSGISETNGTVISLGSVNNIEPFEATLNGLSRGKKYFYVAFVRSNNKKFLGLETNFTTGSHNITSITPASASAGDHFIIQGNNFSPNPSSITVYVGTAIATVSAASETQIEAILPLDITGGSKSVKVKIEDIEVTAGSEITVAPYIESISASWGFGYDIVEITGSGFGSLSEVSVKFNDKIVGMNSSSYNKISVIIPPNSGGVNSVKVVTNTTPSSNTINFKILGWRKLTDLPFTARFSSSSFIINDKLYVGFGSSFSNTRFEDFWKVDLQTGAATQLNDFPQGKRFATQFFTIGDKGYIVLGYDNTAAPLTELWEYDPSGDQWTQKTSFPGQKRSSPVSFVLDGKAYVGTGIANGITSLDDMYSFNPTLNQWDPVVNFGGGQMYGLSSFVIGGKSYVAGGVKNNTTIVNELWEFNGADWAVRADYPGILITDGLGFGYGNFGFFGFGWIDQNNAGIENWLYKQATDSWKQVENFPGPGRFGAISGGSDKYWYMGLGYKGNTEYKDIWIVELP